MHLQIMSNPRGKISAVWKRLIQEVAHQDISEEKIIGKWSESRSLCGSLSHDHMFKELLELLTQKHAPGPRSSGSL